MHLEHRLTEAAFRSYEDFLQRAIAAWPKETQVTVPKGIAPTTYVARCRDAIASYRRFNWPSSISRSTFEAIDGTFRISLDLDGTVWFRARAYQGRPAGKVVSNTIPSAQTSSGPARGALGPWNISDTPDSVLRAFCVLFHHKRLEVPVIFIGQFLESITSSYESEYDVAFNYDPARNETVLL